MNDIPTTWRDYIVRVLRDAEEALDEREIARRVIAAGYPTAGRTPERTVSRELTTNPDLFESIGSGRYRLQTSVVRTRVDETRQTNLERRPQRYWALLAQPNIYDIERAVQSIDVDSWTTKGRDLRIGDRVLIWKAKGRDPVRGIVALGEVVSDPESRAWEEDTSVNYWVKSPAPSARELRADVRYVISPNCPLWLDGPAHDLLSDLSVSRGQGTVFNVTSEQWEAVLIAAGGWPLNAPEIDDARAAIDEISGRHTSGQGFRASSVQRQAIERHAMACAISHYQDEGWVVHDVSATRSYDLHGFRADGSELRIEVKGTTGGGGDILLTPNEVDHAREHFPQVALFILHRIRLIVDDNGTRALDGVSMIIDPWDINNGNLKPIGYIYSPNEPFTF